MNGLGGGILEPTENPSSIHQASIPTNGGANQSELLHVGHGLSRSEVQSGKDRPNGGGSFMSLSSNTTVKIGANQVQFETEIERFTQSNQGSVILKKDFVQDGCSGGTSTPIRAANESEN